MLPRATKANRHGVVAGRWSADGASERTFACGMCRSLRLSACIGSDIAAYAVCTTRMVHTKTCQVTMRCPRYLSGPGCTRGGTRLQIFNARKEQQMR
ncbi:hypothetical protein CPI04_06010 [Moraxella catarrhalis]|nr:hypothetical protein [Moraxella catarrhalis]